MKAIRPAIIVLGMMLLGIAAVTAELPEFKAGAAVNMGLPVSLDLLSQGAEIKYEMVTEKESLVVYRLNESTGDWVYVSGDGSILVARTAEFDFDAMDDLRTELSDAIDFIAATGTNVSAEERKDAMDGIVYYGNYHSLKYPFIGNCEIHLVVPNCTIEAARFSVDGSSYYRGECSTCDKGHEYYINGTKITFCARPTLSSHSGYCRVPQAEITERLMEGTFNITSKDVADDEEMTMNIEIITSSEPQEPFLLYAPQSGAGITETADSHGLEALREATYLDI